MYLKRLIIVSIITISVAYATGRFFDQAYRKRWSTLFFEKTDHLVKQHESYDIIFLGNSRVHFGINPYYIDSITTLNSYNFGTGGADAEDIMLTGDLYLQNHPVPRVAIISLDMGALIKNEVLKTRFHYLYYLDQDSIYQHMKKTGFLTAMIKALPFLKYSFFDEYNRTSLFVTGKTLPVFDHNIHKGFLNIHQHINSSAAGIYNVKPDYDSLWATSITYFRNIISQMQQKGTLVVFVTPPEKISSRNRGTAFRKVADSIFIQLATEYRLKHWHFEKDPHFTDEYFVDDIHLNEPGTRIYSKQLADSINSIFTKQGLPSF